MIGTALAIAASPVLAVEGAVGRTLPGVWIMPQAGVVSPKPGFRFTLLPIGYMGSISKDHLVPIAGTLVANVSADVSANYVVPQYVYKTELPKISIASTFMAPVNWVGVDASGQLNEATRNRSNANAGLADIIIQPLTVGIHFSETNNLAVSAMIFAPTGAYNRGNLSNVGMGVWTFMPNIAHTIMWEKRGLELDNLVGFDIYARNPNTQYKSGTVFHWDAMLVQYLSKRVGFGVIGSNITQITNDTSSGPFASTLHGFEGRAWGAGPMALYVAKPEKPGVTIQVRWVPEFGVTNLLSGNTLLLGLSIQFK